MNSSLYAEMAKFQSLNSRLKFEVVSLMGRTLFKRRGRIRTDHEPLLLDVGVGNNFTPGWTHADFYRIPLNPIHWVNNIHSHERRPEVELDLRYPLDCRDNTCDGVYCSHTIEHLLPQHAIRLIGEFYRILKPQTYLRLIVPDFAIILKKYLSKNYPEGFSAGAELIMYYTQMWGHVSTWDEEYLTQVLANAGFVNIQVVEYGVGGSDRRLIKEEPVRKDESIVIEAQKPGAAS